MFTRATTIPFRSREQKGSNSLGIVVHHRSVEIVVITPVIGGAGAENNMRNRAGNLYSPDSFRLTKRNRMAFHARAAAIPKGLGRYPKRAPFAKA